MIGIDPQPPGHETAAHFGHRGTGGGEQFVRLCRIDTDQDTALPARRDRHVAVHQEGEAPEHFLFGDVGRAVEKGADAGGQLFVVRHRPSLYRNHDGLPHVRRKYTTSATTPASVATPRRIWL